MARSSATGKTGEQMALLHLRENGYSILETNWRLGRHEADIIACKDGVIAFVEVKTRSSLRFGTPQEAVDYNKQRTYMRLANAYVRMKKRTEEVRFDIIAIEINREGFNLNL